MDLNKTLHEKKAALPQKYSHPHSGMTATVRWAETTETRAHAHTQGWHILKWSQWWRESIGKTEIGNMEFHWFYYNSAFLPVESSHAPCFLTRALTRSKEKIYSCDNVINSLSGEIQVKDLFCSQTSTGSVSSWTLSLPSLSTHYLSVHIFY